MNHKPFKQRLSGWLKHEFTDTAIITFIVISVFIVVAENAMVSDSLWHPILARLDWIIISIFSLELSLRFYVAPRKIVFFKRYWIDIISILPVFHSFRFLRVLRLLRIFRLGIMLNRRLSRVSYLFTEIYGEYYSIALLVMVIILAGSISIFLLESNITADHRFLSDFAYAFWWTLYTLISAEMGPIEPVTVGGKIITIFIMLSGMTLFAMFTGLIAAAMTHRLKLGMEDRMQDVQDLENHTIICGWNRQGRMIVEELLSDKAEKDRSIVIAAELTAPPVFDPRIVRKESIYFIFGDCTNVDVLRRANAMKADKVVILADKSKERSDQDRDARTVLTALTIEKLNPKIFTCAELLNRDNEVHLRIAGVEEVIIGDEVVANVLAASSRNRGIIQVINELFTSKIGNEFIKVKAPLETDGQSFFELSGILKRKHNAILVAIDRQQNGKHDIHVNPDVDFKICTGDQLILIAIEIPDFEAMKK